MATVRIEPISCLRDNYCYLITCNGTQDAWLVDPSEVDAPSRVLSERRLTLRGILATHHHWDHVNGITGLRQRHGTTSWVAGHAHDRGRIPDQDIFCEAPSGRFEPTEVEVAGHRLTAAHIPGHTLGAIGWCIPTQPNAPANIFTGDTLFAAGCGRLFEGTPGQMLSSLQTICDHPDDTRLWFGHEYTAANLRFAAATEPDNEQIQARLQGVGSCTTPTTVAQEKLTNPFVRAGSADELARRRQAKDNF